MQVRYFHYINGVVVESDFSQILGRIVSEIVTTSGSEIKGEGGGEVSLGSILSALGLNLKLTGNLSKKSIRSEEVRTSLSQENKLMIVEEALKKNSLMREIDLEGMDETDLISQLDLNLGRDHFYKLSGQFDLKDVKKGERDYVVYDKSVGKAIVRIPCSHMFMTQMRSLDFIGSARVTCLAMYGGRSSYDSENVHVFYPHAMWGS